MRPSVLVVHDMVAALVPADALEAQHRVDALSWLRATDDVFRGVKPATPARHLVSYVVPVDPTDGSVLLVDHINSGLWLPPGGHVEPDEHPAQTARREALEELGLAVSGDGSETQPEFLTVTRTVGVDAGHTDVSLWFVVECARDQPLTPDRSEFRAVRWWSPADLHVANATDFDPHLTRFVSKVTQQRTRYDC